LADFCKHVLLQLILLGCCFSNTAARAEQPFNTVKFRSAQDAAYRNKLQTLADQCDKDDLKAQAEITRAWFIVRDPRRQYIFLADQAHPLAVPGNAEEAVKKWSADFMKLRSEQAAWLFGMAKSLINEQPAIAYQLLYETLHENPDHLQAREMLGFERTESHWSKPEREIRTRQLKMRHDALPDELIWRAESEHFKVLTTTDEKTAVAVAEEFERWYDVWQQVFFEFWAGADHLQTALDGKAAKPRPTKHTVVVYVDKAEYDSRLGNLIPGIEKSSGYYTDKLRQSFFFVGKDDNSATWRHELTHQLFQELMPVRRSSRAPSVAKEHGVWILEGIAMYMESLREFDRFTTVGGFESPRLQFARLRRFREGFRPRTDMLMSLSLDEFQENEDIQKLYSVSAGYCHYLMDGDDGRLRGKTIEYLRQLYAGKSKPLQLLDEFETTPEDFDKAYAAFLFVSHRDLSDYFLDPESVKQLSLAPSNLDDDHMAFLSKAIHLELLDLSSSKVGDQGLAQLANCKVLRQLYLERAPITDKALLSLAKLETLEELDLSQTAISNEGLAQLSTLTNLKVLWLSGTKIDDTGLQHLRNLAKLQMLEVSGTGVTSAGLKQLKQALPDLE